MKSLFKILEEVQLEKELVEAKGDLDMGDDAGAPPVGGKSAQKDAGAPPVDDDDDEEKEEKLSDNTPDGKGHYTADDLREIIDYVRNLLKDEVGDDDDDDDKEGDDIGEIGLDLIYEYADLLPETVINQIVDDLKDMFEIEDTMLESIINEGAAFFNKAKKSPAAIAARSVMLKSYAKNKKKIIARNKKWRNTEIGKKIAALHHKIFKTGMSMGKVKGKRVVSQL